MLSFCSISANIVSDFSSLSELSLSKIKQLMRLSNLRQL